MFKRPTLLLLLAAGIISLFVFVMRRPTEPANTKSNSIDVLREEASALPGLTQDDALNRVADYRITTSRSRQYTICPGETETYAFTIKNSGQKRDTYTIVPTTKRGWADFSALPSKLRLWSSKERVFEIPIHVPIGTRPAKKEEISLEVTSQAEPHLSDASTIIIEVAVCENI